MRIGVLGPLEVRTRQGEPVEVAGARLRTLMVRLALDAGRVVTTRQLVDALWGDEPPAGATNALQALVSRLRRTVPDLVIESHPAGYRLTIDPDEVDAHRFERLVTQQSNEDCVDDCLREALALWRGPALAEVADADFARGPAVRLTELRLDAIERAADLLPVAELDALSREHPTRERLTGRLMRALDRDGRPADALAAYERTRSALADQLGVDPSAELAALHLALLRGPETPRPRSNLRASLTSFVGRDVDVARVASLVAVHRLVTLVGPGGAGKTRLALESARTLVGAYPDGVWLVELAPVTDPAELAATVLTVLGLREQTLLVTSRALTGHGSTVDTTERLVQALRDKRLLIVLDNCEHLVAGAAALSEEVLGRCPAVRVLATSREPLAIFGETLWTVESLEASAAVRLFADRAAAARPDFRVDAHAAEVCRALDGMPLAIELAAARLRTMTAAQLAQRLDDRFRVLIGGSRTALPRHQTLRAVVDWSWDLLDEDERRLWQRLSVFAGASLEAAVAVCGLGPATVDIAYGLVEKSLLTVSGDVEPRFGMLETIRAYGRERLAASGDEEKVRSSYVQYFLDLAERAEPHLRTRDQLAWLNRLRAEHDNLHQALRVAMAIGDTVAALRLVAGLGSYWWLAGHRAEGADLAEEVLALPGEVDDHLRAQARAVSALNVIDGNRPFDQIQQWIDETARLAERVEPDTAALRVIGPLRDMITATQAGESAVAALSTLVDDPDPWVRATGRLLRAHSVLNLGRDLPTAEEDLRGALREFTAIGERWGLSSSLAALAEEVSRDGEHERSAAMWSEAVSYLEELGSLEDIPHFLVKYAHEQWLAGDAAAGRRTLDRAEAAADAVGSREGRATALVERAEQWRAQGELDAARAALDRGMELLASVHPAAQLSATAHTAAGRLARARGDLAAARSEHERALAHAIASVDAPVIGRTVLGFAELAAAEGRYAKAAALLGAAAGIRGAPDRTVPDLDQLERTVRAELGDAAFDESYLDGRATAAAGRFADLV